jgi:hypothetical protein
VSVVTNLRTLRSNCLSDQQKALNILISVTSIPGAEKGFRLLFSAPPFPGFTVKLDWRREEYAGN